MKIWLTIFTPYQTVQMQIAALASYLKHSNIEVAYSEYYIFSGESFEKHRNQVREDILREKPDIVGFSTYDMNYHHTLDCASFIKELDSNIKTIAGGHTASVVPFEFLDYDCIDFIGKVKVKKLSKNWHMHSKTVYLLTISKVFTGKIKMEKSLLMKLAL